MKNILIGVGGGTCAGKTTLVNFLIKEFKENIVVIQLHDYTYSGFRTKKLREINFDDPKIIRWGMLKKAHKIFN